MSFDEKEYQRQYRQTHKEKAREFNKEWRNKNKEKSQLNHKKWRAANPDKLREIQKRADTRRHFGSVQRYNEGMLKYEGECAFACDRDATLVHHMDGKSYRNSPKQEANNNLNNLLPLCATCHTWLHNKVMWKRRFKHVK